MSCTSKEVYQLLFSLCHLLFFQQFLCHVVQHSQKIIITCTKTVIRWKVVCKAFQRESKHNVEIAKIYSWHFSQKLREINQHHNVFMSTLSWRNIFQVWVNFLFFHSVVRTTMNVFKKQIQCHCPTKWYPCNWKIAHWK